MTAGSGVTAATGTVSDIERHDASKTAPAATASQRAVWPER
jgi:hypothetical protein